jgi:flagellar biosynthesis anti-sigma factor FlgM
MQINSGAIRSVYQQNTNEVSSNRQSSNKNANVSSQGDLSKVENIKKSMEDGTYKVDLQKLAEKLADNLL